MIEARNLTKRFGDIIAVDHVNATIRDGSVFGLIGTNGAGKSTLLKAILGENEYSGSLTFVDGNKKMSRRPIIGYVPQKLDFDYSSPVSVLDVFACTQSNRPVYFSPDKKVKDVALRSLRKVQGENLINKRLGVLSGGELQRVLLSLALEPIPDILLLDEPVSGIDQNGLKLFYSIVSNLRENYDLLVSHDLNVVYDYADRVAFLNNKTIECVGKPEEVFSNKSVIDTFGLELNKKIDKIGRGGMR